MHVRDMINRREIHLCLSVELMKLMWLCSFESFILGNLIHKFSWKPNKLQTLMAGKNEASACGIMGANTCMYFCAHSLLPHLAQISWVPFMGQTGFSALRTQQGSMRSSWLP